MDPLGTLFLVGFANASFCALFGGDWTARLIVFSATLIGFYINQIMQKKKINHYLVFIVSAFVASMVASSALTLETTAEIAIATSVLYLVPGVPLLNGVIDIVEGHVLTGCTRLIQALLLVLCISVGLSCTLMLIRNSLLLYSLIYLRTAYLPQLPPSVSERFQILPCALFLPLPYLPLSAMPCVFV